MATQETTTSSLTREETINNTQKGEIATVRVIYVEPSTGHPKLVWNRDRKKHKKSNLK